jgi:Holliday junction resolvasome RuvABC ATP-dependent DNA helicase subunit
MKTDYDFLISQARKILFSLEPLFKIFRRDFISSLVGDLMKLAALICAPKKRLKDAEVFFMTATLFAMSQSVDIKKKDQVCEILNRFSGAADVKRVKKLWPVIRGFFPEKTDIASLTLPSFDGLKDYDAEHGSSHFDLVRGNFSRFVHSLIKADGTVSPAEKRMERKINRVLFPSGSPPEEDDDDTGIDLFSLFNQKGKGGALVIKGGKSGIKVTFGGSGRMEVETGDQAEDGEKEPAGGGIEREDVNRAEGLDTVIQELHSLIGLANIKEQITTLINLLKIKKERLARGLPETETTLHSVFFGSPGTGKTTVARLLGRVFRCLGLLEKGHVVETDRAGLVAGFVGQTAIQTDKLVSRAMDGILFVDEAYALQGSGNDFGREAVDTILKRMEDHRDRLVVIVAGYPDEMEAFLTSNPGLKSRFSRYFNFKDYTPPELVSIFARFCGHSALKLTAPAEKKLLALFQKAYEDRDKSFGNGRLARNLFEKVVERQANRLVEIAPLTDQILSTVTKDDIPGL